MTKTEFRKASDKIASHKPAEILRSKYNEENTSYNVTNTSYDAIKRCPCFVIFAQYGRAKSSLSVIMAKNLLFGEMILSDFDQSNLRICWQVWILPSFLVFSVNFPEKCQNRLRVNSDGDETLA